MRKGRRKKIIEVETALNGTVPVCEAELLPSALLLFCDGEYDVGLGICAGDLIAVENRCADSCTDNDPIDNPTLDDVCYKPLERAPDSTTLDKYARLAEVLAERRIRDRETAWQALVDLLTDWTRRLNLPPLSAYGVAEDGLDHVVAHSRGSSMKTNPIVLEDGEIREVLESRL